MKKRLISPAALALAVAAGVGGGALPAATASASGNTLNVWLMTGDSTPAVLNSVDSAFTQANPGWTVNVEIQQWGGISTKLITALSGSAPPDVMEIGNTDVAEFAASGGLTNLAPDKSQFDNSSKWLTGLEGPAEYNGGLYAIPELGGDRVVVYNKQMFSQAGITHTPTSLQQLVTDGAALKKHFSNVKNFSPFYLPGEEWYAAMPFVWADGGQIAVEKGGKWSGDLTTASLAGLKLYQQIQNSLSTPASKNLNENQGTGDSAIFAAGKAAMFIDGNWTLGTDRRQQISGQRDRHVHPPGRKAWQCGARVPRRLRPGHRQEQPQPGSSTRWVKLFTGNINQLNQGKLDGLIPNATNLIRRVSLSPNFTTYFKAAAESQFTPPVPGWATVEADNVMQDLFAQVAEGNQSIANIAKQYDQKLDSLLNSL